MVFLMGPTASGKTDLAISLSRRFPFDIINVDAAQVYRQMDIGTAKPDAAILRTIRHGLIDVCDPAERYSAGRFRTDALNEIRNSLESGRIPLLVGGSMFYFKALSDGLSQLPKASERIGAEIRKRASEIGWPALHAELARVDSKVASTIDPHDSQRIQRMLELFYSEGRSASAAMRDSPPKPMPYDCVKLALTRGDRLELRNRISERFKLMLERGFIDEARFLYERPDLDSSLPSMRSAGYKQAWQYFDGQLNYETMVEKSIHATCAIAKRQLTWLRNSRAVAWVDSSDPKALELASRYLDSRISRDAT